MSTCLFKNTIAAQKVYAEQNKEISAVFRAWALGTYLTALVVCSMYYILLFY